MIPVVLVYLPSSNYLLGTFDTVNFTNWWISTGFDNVDFIIKGMQIFGSEHIAICKMTNGTYSIFRSKDYAQTWIQVLNTSSKIIDFVKINFGWAIANFSDGFYETVNAGRTWARVSSLPSATASALCNIGDGDILVCTDGRYVWRSLNIARTWIPSLIETNHHTNPVTYENVASGDMNKILHDAADDYGQFTPLLYTGQSVPCIVGACDMVIIGHGPWMAVSYDNCATVSAYTPWDYYAPNADGNGNPLGLCLDLEANTQHSSFPNKEMFQDRRDGYLVSQVLIGEISGLTPQNIAWIIKTTDIKQRLLSHTRVNVKVGDDYWVDTYEPLMNRVCKTFKGKTLYSPITEYDNFWIKYMYSQLASPTAGEQLSSVQVLPAGSGQMTTMLFSIQSQTTSGNALPQIRYSKDGGMTWISINTTSITTYKGSIPTGNGGAFLDDTFGYGSWTHGVCDNVGQWNPTPGHRKMNMSYDIGGAIEAPAIVTNHVVYNMYGYVSGKTGTSYNIQTILFKVPILHYDINGSISLGKSVSYSDDLILSKKIIGKYYANGSIKAVEGTSYAMQGYVQLDEVPIIEQIQAINLKLSPEMCSRIPYDSRNEA
jgi:hypothetical protein